MLLKYLLFLFKSQGFKGLFLTISQRLLPKRAVCFEFCENAVSNKIGLEIGGPSGVFKKKGILPLYPTIKNLDNCNFAGLTTWEGKINEGPTFRFNKNATPGRQYLSEASDLSTIASDQYDFILSSHMLEHTANPLQALSEWLRVLKENGMLIIIVPHKDGTFDHKRPITTLNHLIEDFTSGIKEDDLTHLPEIIELHDMSRDPGIETSQAFKERSENNFENRCFHHHVFDANLLIHTLNHACIQIHAVECILPYHIIVVGQKRLSKEQLNNEAFLRDEAAYRNLSPFASDKVSSK
jgi:SAM-dependent methyltransferase